MSRTTGNNIADSLEASLGYAERLLRDIPGQEAARFARPGGQVVESNHPCFIVGHLCLYPAKVLEQLGHEPPTVPAGFEEAFSKTATCQDDPDGNLYPPFDAVMAFFLAGHQQLVAVLRQTPNEAFDRENPADGPLKKRFPTLSSMHAFYCGGHLMMHLGQLSAWRRMHGLPPA
ncbi:MAG: DinB family protein [Planctomycetia bacterium]|jgi:hypothetical protein|nr:DinB family protein [Planctomycetia bacterium]